MTGNETSPLWQPDPSRIERTRLAAFIALLERRGHGPFANYESLHWFSVDQPGAFWNAVWDFVGVIGTKGEQPIARAKQIFDTRFFPDASLNVAENLLRPDASPDDVVLIGCNEDGVSERLTRRDLLARVGHMQALLRARNVGIGDAVVVMLPNVADAYITMLAAVGLGATFASTSPDFGADGVLDRFAQVEPVVLVACQSYRYGGRDFDCSAKVGEVLRGLATVTACFIVDHGDSPPPAGTERLSSALESVESADPVFERLPFDHPLYVLFSSGTTGRPKPIVHRAGGVLLTHMKEQQLACDIGPGDRVFYFTTAGWMMWNWLASAMASEAAIVVYDGNPAHPAIDHLFELVDDVGITFFGTSAKFLESLMKSGVQVSDRHGLSTLRSIASTGSPLSSEGFVFVYEQISPDVHLASISGGTDLCGCLVGGDPTGPVYPGEIQRPMLAMAVDIVDDVGRSLPPGEQGELVCTRPFPSMPLTFLGENGDERYRSTYFERFDNVWHQGDFAEWTPQGGLIIHGRSDATLNPGGVRIGTAEIYSQLDKIDAVLEALVIGQRRDADTRIVLFVHLDGERSLDDELESEIRATIRAGATPRHVPAVIVAVSDLPRTRSGKLAEIAVRDVVHGNAVTNREALANPEALDLFKDLERLR